MPGLKELNNFRNNLQNIANEANVVSQWKERYEEYPYPENPPLPDVDVDDLLGNIELPIPPSQEMDEAQNVEDQTSSINNGTDDLDSVIGGMDNFASENIPSDNLGGIDLPPPDIFSIPTDLDFNNLPSVNEDSQSDSIPVDDGAQNNEVKDDFLPPPSLLDVEKEPVRKSKNKKIDLDKWNASQDEKTTNDAERYVPKDDFLPPFDETIKDDSNEEGFLLKEDEEPIVNDLDLSKFDLGDDTEDESTLEQIEEPTIPSIDEIDIPPRPFEKDSSANIEDVPIIDLSKFDTDDFGKQEQEEGKNDEPIETIEAGQDTEPQVDLSSFDFDNTTEKSDSPIEELNTESNQPLDTIKDTSSIDSTSFNDEEVASLDKIEDIPTLDDDEIEEIEPIEELDAVSENEQNEQKTENIGDFNVEIIDHDDIPEDNSDNMFPLSSAELDSMEAQDKQENQQIDLGAFDTPEENDINLYTEPENDLEESEASTESGIANQKQELPSEFDTFSNIDVSSSGEEAHIDEHASFTISNNILDESISDTVGGFSIPDDYTQFSQNDFSYSNAKDKGKSDEDIALSITEEEYQRLLERISSFPLNVRLEIEDYLAHNDDTTISKMEFVHLIISGARLKKIASKLSEILEKPIPIPKGFERKTAEEYEAEKKSFKYKLRHKIIPFATIAGITLLLTACICFLFWTFVYIPIVSETIYSKGYTLLEENKYSDAMKEFNNAGDYKKKKRWYFKYANGFRNKKQFQLAEDVYKKLLFDFNHDKEGGLEYASMLRDDLHNYEKAETVLKRSVLDYHVNDKDALTSLGDTYLEWAGENSEKYEKARQTYSSLISMYGRKDPFLSRMMKYFIRTDNLKEVLPLKEYFKNNMKKLDTEDLTELGAYLITKRYENNVDDDDYIEYIDDVRDILEVPLKRNKDDANANYNMGRFFLYNRNFDVAEHYLAKSIDTYKNINNLSSKGIMNSIDARRLYGEILSDNKEYLKAQEVYADALSIYKEYSNNRLTSPNKNVGKLYSDYADINYFISGDLDKALQAYTMATNQMNDTPSIKYRIGYIHYQHKNYEDAMKSFLLVHTEKKDDKNLLYGLGNTLYKRGSYYVAQAYYERLMEMLEAEKIRKQVLFPHSRPDHNAFINEYMQATNNLGVILNKLAMQDGSSEKNGRAIALFGESSRAWDALTRNPETMVASKAVSLAYLNIQNVIKPQTGFETEIYSDIPKTLENEIVLTKEVDR